MYRIRSSLAALVVTMSALLPSTALAADPTVEVIPGPATGLVDEAVPLTRSELRAIAARERQAAQVVATFDKGRDRSTAEVTALCPSSASEQAALEATSIARAADSPASFGATPAERIAAVAGSGSCVSDFLAVYPRQQIKSYYCGPATVQQVINYTRGIFTWDESVNSFRQQSISDLWLKADANGGTSPYRERVGMNAGSRLPAGFTYYEYQVTSGADWHGKVITDVTGWNMPLTAAVAPRDVGAPYFLSSWANSRPVNTGHWIVVRGYYGKWDGTRGPLVYYTDSSGGAGGSTGRFYDPSYDVYWTLVHTNAIHRQGKWIVW